MLPVQARSACKQGVLAWVTRPVDNCYQCKLGVLAWVTRPVDNWLKVYVIEKHRQSEWHLVAVEGIPCSSCHRKEHVVML